MWIVIKLFSIQSSFIETGNEARTGERSFEADDTKQERKKWDHTCTQILINELDDDLQVHATK